MLHHQQQANLNRKQAIAWAQHLGLKAAHHNKGSERRAELQALADRVIAELGDQDSLSINLNDREQFLSASHRPVAKQFDSCQTTWRR